MESLIKREKDILIYENVQLYSKTKGIAEDRIICSLAYKFAKNLPFSMDIVQEEYVPADFINVKPYDAGDSYFFKYNDSVYDAMISWGDTFKSGVLLQVCAIFQKMLINEFPNDYVLTENEYYTWKINEMTTREEYNRRFFEVLKKLPLYYNEINSCTSVEERRNMLERIYGQMQQAIANRVGGMRRTNVVNGEVVSVTEQAPTIIWAPGRDLEMLYHFQQVSIIGDVNSVITDIKQMKLSGIRKIENGENLNSLDTNKLTKKI